MLRRLVIAAFIIASLWTTAACDDYGPHRYPEYPGKFGHVMMQQRNRSAKRAAADEESDVGVPAEGSKSSVPAKPKSEAPASTPAGR